MSSYYDDPDFADEYRRRDEDALDWAIEERERSNHLAPDGYRYGVMFNDGSVAAQWNGRTQRERAQYFANLWAKRFEPDNITLARRRPGEPWERVTEGGE